MLHKLNYILDNFKKVYKIDALPAGISYGPDDHAKILIRQGDTGPLTRGEMYFPSDDQIVWKPWKGTLVPFFFGNDTGELISRSGDQLCITQDIIASAFYLLSGWQEYFSDSKDQYGRFPFSSSLQKRLNITGKPIVNYYFDILKTVMEQASGMRFAPATWHGKPYALCLTHDIDTCETAWMEGSYSAIKKSDPFSPFLLIGKKLFGRDAWFNFSDILRIEQKFSANSTFFFLATNIPEMGIKNADYSLNHPKFRRVQEYIAGAGSEVGIHGSAGTSRDLNKLISEVNCFLKPVKGNRFHFLLYDPALSGQLIDAAGLSYDTSLGFAEQPGFRNSFCFPFHPWDIKNDRPFQHIEIPLTLMDGTLQQYLNLQPAEANSLVEPLFEEVRKFGGCMTILWHNTHFSSYKYPGWKEVYIHLLQTAQKDNAGLFSCLRLLDHYSSGKTQTQSES